MRLGHPAFCLMLISVVLTASVVQSAPVRAQEAGEGDGQIAEAASQIDALQPAAQDARLILAFYYAWFDWSTWASEVCDQPTQLYVSEDMSAIDRHIQEAQRVGIDAFVQAWYGPTLVGNPTEPNLSMLLEEADGHGFRVAVMVDMTGEFLQTTDDVADALAAIRDDHAAHSAYLRYEGRPVVFFLGQALFSLPAWEAMRNRVDPAGDMIWIAQGASTDCLSVFDGLYLYNAADGALSATEVVRHAGEVRQWGREHATTRLWVAQVLPGYDDSSIADEDDAILRLRRGGEAYRESWSAAANSEPDWIVIRSYNEWTHCTHIEPSVGYSRTYLDLTSELVMEYRYPPTPTPQPTASPVPTSPTPTETPMPAEGTPAPEATVIVTPTVVLTPTATITPTATPFRLSTPTPTAAADQVQPGEAPMTPSPQRPADSPGSQTLAGTVTPVTMPRLPVEGATPRRCSLLPALLPLVAAVIVRRGTGPLFASNSTRRRARVPETPGVRAVRADTGSS